MLFVDARTADESPDDFSLLTVLLDARCKMRGDHLMRLSPRSNYFGPCEVSEAEYSHALDEMMYPYVPTAHEFTASHNLQDSATITATQWYATLFLHTLNWGR